MMKSLLNSLSYEEHEKAVQMLTRERCVNILRIVKQRRPKMKNIELEEQETAKKLISTLDRWGIDVKEFRELVFKNAIEKTKVYYQPRAKVAILIGNDQYKYQRKLATPSKDCDSLSVILKELGFQIIKLINTNSEALKKILTKLLEDTILEDTYCFIYYAGHGCEVGNVRCLMPADCPLEDIQVSELVTEHFVLELVARARPELCVLLMDMCRVHLESTANPNLQTLPQSEEYPVHRNLILGYSTSGSENAYEQVLLECSSSVIENATMELSTNDQFVPQNSLYARSLCRYLAIDLDVSSMLDKVHEDVANGPKEKQRPIKLEFGGDKRSLHDPALGDMDEFYEQLRRTQLTLRLGSEHTVLNGEYSDS